MPEFYCGTSNVLPPGYQRKGNQFECMRKGFGACKYNGRQGSKHNPGAPPRPPRAGPRRFCGSPANLPVGAQMGENFECLRRGYGVCLYSPPAVPCGVPVAQGAIPQTRRWSFLSNFWFWFSLICIIVVIILLIIFLR